MKYLVGLMAFLFSLSLFIFVHADTTPFTFSTNLYYGLTSPDVVQLQILLNKNPATQIATTGYSSPGYEIPRFGPKTVSAVKRFQTLHGLPRSGYVGAQTRAALNQLIAPTAVPVSNPQQTVTPPTVSGICKINNFIVDQNPVSVGTGAHLHWDTTGCASVVISNVTNSPIPLSGDIITDPLTTSVTFELTATDALGKTTNWDVPVNAWDDGNTGGTTATSKIVSVINFGAKGDGVTNDAPAIQSAVDAVAQAGGGTVLVPAGTYLLDYPRPLPNSMFSLLIVKSNVDITGEDSNGQSRSIFKVANDLNGQQTALNNPQAWAFPQFLVMSPGPQINSPSNALSHAHFSNLTIDLNGSHNGYGPMPVGATVRAGHYNTAFMARGITNDITFDGMTFLNAPGGQVVQFARGTTGNWSSDIHLRHNTVHNVADAVPGNAETDHSSFFIQANNWSVEDNTFINDTPSNVATAIEFYGSNGTVTGNHITNYDTGMNVVAETYDLQATISNNMIENPIFGLDMWIFGKAYLLPNTPPPTIRDTSISNNTIHIRDTSDRAAIYANNTYFDVAPENLVIKNNILGQLGTPLGKSSIPSGIVLTKGHTVSITGNTFSNLGGRGLSLNGMFDSVLISGNTSQDVGQGNNPSHPATPKDYSQGMTLLAGGTDQITHVCLENNTLISHSSDMATTNIQLNGNLSSISLGSGNSTAISVGKGITTQQTPSCSTTQIGN